jgi:hypothetical protein
LARTGHVLVAKRSWRGRDAKRLDHRVEVNGRGFGEDLKRNRLP